MTYFVVDVKIKVIDMKVSVPTKLESLELDLPRGRNEFLKLREVCRSKGRESVEISCPLLTRKTMELAHVIKMKVVDPEVSFPTTSHLSNLDLCSEKYGHKNRRRCQVSG